MKRVLCLIDSLGPGGAQRQMVGLAALLSTGGGKTKVITYHDIPFYAPFLKENGVEYECVSCCRGILDRLRKIKGVIKSFDPDVVISFLDTPNILTSLLRINNKKWLLIVSERNTSQKKGLRELLRFNLYRFADFVVPNAFSQERFIKQHFPFLSPKVVTIPNFVDLDFFVPPAIRTRSSSPEVIIVASIRPSKNAINLIEAVASLKSKGNQFHISWYGKSDEFKDYYCQCSEIIQQRGVADVIDLKEKTYQIKERYQAADYFCLPSFYEGTPNVICEAMACGLPVACSDVCDNPRYVSEGENGALFDPVDVGSIVKAFDKLFSLEESEYRDYCRRSREKAEALLSKERFVDSYWSLIGK